MFNITPIVRNLLIVNVLFFLLQNYFHDGLRLIGYLQSYNELPFMEKNFALLNSYLPNNPDGNLINPDFRPWMLITYMFLHGDFGHLFSNMFGLVMFGSTVESYMGSKKFLKYYLITGIGAAVLHSITNAFELSQITDPNTYRVYTMIPTVGASGAIFGVLIGYAYKYPDNELMIFPLPIPIKAKYFIALYGLYELTAGSFSFSTGIAHFAHLGGLITGFILLKYFNFNSGGYNRWR
jgi:membrane associated rhomboid family serine protease